MLPKLSSLMMLFLIGAALLGLLIYALATLRGMKHRRFCPLLRLKRRDGTLLTMKIENGPVNHTV